jgi:hypothetical protein
MVTRPGSPVSEAMAVCIAYQATDELTLAMRLNIIQHTVEQGSSMQSSNDCNRSSAALWLASMIKDITRGMGKTGKECNSQSAPQPCYLVPEPSGSRRLTGTWVCH